MTTCCVPDYEPAEIWSVKMFKARVTHRCGECGVLIQKGRLYVYISMLFQGRWSNHKQCARCANVTQEYMSGCVPGQVAEDFENCYGFDYRDGVPDDFTPCRGTKA